MATSCNKFCVSQLCKDRKNCSCKCEEWFSGTNPVLVQSCEGACWNDPSIKDRSMEDYLCENLDPQEVFNRHGYICPNFNPLEDSAQGLAYTEQQKSIDAQSSNTRNTIIFAFVFLVVLLIIYLYMKK